MNLKSKHKILNESWDEWSNDEINGGGIDFQRKHTQHKQPVQFFSTVAHSFCWMIECDLVKFDGSIWHWYISIDE